MGFFIVLAIAAIFFLLVQSYIAIDKRDKRMQMTAASGAEQPTSANSTTKTMPVSDIIKTVGVLTARIELMHQAAAVGDDATYQSMLNNKYSGPLPELRSDGGYMSMYDNLRIMSIKGINYCTNIDKYQGRIMVALVPEPKNEFDPDAIKIVAEDSHRLGYIPSNQTNYVRSLTGNTFPYHCRCYITENEDELDGHKFYCGYVYIVRKGKGE